MGPNSKIRAISIWVFFLCGSVLFDSTSIWADPSQSCTLDVSENESLNEIANVLFENHLQSECSPELNLPNVKALFASSSADEKMNFTQQAFCMKTDSGKIIGCRTSEKRYLASVTKLYLADYIVSKKPDIEIGTLGCFSSSNGALTLESLGYSYTTSADVKALLSELGLSNSMNKVKSVCVSDALLVDATGCADYGNLTVNIRSAALNQSVRSCALAQLKKIFPGQGVVFKRGDDCQCGSATATSKQATKKQKVTTLLKKILARSDSFQINQMMTHLGLSADFKKYLKDAYQVTVADTFGASDLNQATCEQTLKLGLLDPCSTQYLPDGDTPHVTWGSRIDESKDQLICAKTGSKPAQGVVNFAGCFKSDKGPIKSFALFHQGKSCTSLGALDPYRNVQNKMIEALLLRPSSLLNSSK